MVLMKVGTPPGVIGHEVNDHSRRAGMDGPGQLQKLIDGGGSLIKLHQGRIHRFQVLGGIGATESAEPGVGGRRWIDRQQMDDAAPKGIDNVRELFDELPDFP